MLLSTFMHEIGMESANRVTMSEASGLSTPTSKRYRARTAKRNAIEMITSPAIASRIIHSEARILLAVAAAFPRTTRGFATWMRMQGAGIQVTRDSGTAMLPG